MSHLQRRLSRMEADTTEPCTVLVWRDTGDTDEDVRRKVDEKVAAIGGGVAVAVHVFRWAT